MQGLEERGINCRACTTGACCTFSANSMRVTPLEALDLYEEWGDKFDDDLVSRLQATIERFGLDREPAGDGRRSFSRKRYTCPFFGETALGCPLPRAAKPYGCLAFNARSAGVTDGEDCASDVEALAARETTAEERLNAAVKKELGVNWDKESIPVALLALKRRRSQ